ncbi:glycosyltransferase family 2 protein [Roseateles violae]|uniref:Glycosyltransferase family 2 protein n=1 Tax=Roseateles violae TaxID=3058042 RepID=A0ABT8DW02_9BURK|nr:glycosyltransferase family 2 protein [Pelomonas sp. PFR6]MDN3920474.1 glycosyltransferase family 2 protein [Pelomonas sp. PFR6]
MSAPQITFAIPFYGKVDFLDRALASLLAQDFGDWRAIVVDDCSPTDEARRLVESLADGRIEYLRNERNLGLAGNWNRCVQLARTPLVTLLHGDDELMPHYARQMVDAHRRWPDAAAVFCAAAIIDAKGRPMFSFRDHVKRWLLPAAREPFVLEGQAGVSSLLRGNFIMCPTLCYKRRIFEALDFSARWRMVLDVDFYLRALMQGLRLVGIPEVAYRYRRHSEQATAEAERNLRIFTEEIALWHETADQARTRGWQTSERLARRMHIIKLQLLYYIAGDILKLRLESAGKKLGLLAGLYKP